MEKENIKNKIKEIIETIFTGVDSLVDIKSKLNQDIDANRDTLNILSNKIKELESKTSSLESIKNDIDNYKIESEKLDKLNGSLVSELREIESKIESKRLEMNELINEGKSEYEKYLEKTSEEKTFLVQERARLDKEKKRLEKKDEELKIVENRFVRLFEGKNSAFRISN